MNKKTKKALKKLSKEVSAVRKENEKLTRRLEDRLEALEKQGKPQEAQARDASPERSEQVRSAEKEPTAHDVDAPEDREITDAAARKAEELGVDLDEVEGTGSGGRVLVKDVEGAAPNE